MSLEAGQLAANAVSPPPPKPSEEKAHFETGSQRSSGKGKGRYDGISPIMLRRLALLIERGGELYGFRNWEKGFPISRCLDSALRHINQWREGLRDEDHLVQAIFNLMVAIHTMEQISGQRLPDSLYDVPTYLPKENLTSSCDGASA